MKHKEMLIALYLTLLQIIYPALGRQTDASTDIVASIKNNQPPNQLLLYFTDFNSHDVKCFQSCVNPIFCMP